MMTKFEYLLQAFWESCHRFGEVILRNLLHLGRVLFMLGGHLCLWIFKNFRVVFLLSAVDFFPIMIFQYMEDAELADLIQELLNLASSPGWAPRHGSVLAFSALLRHNPSAIFMSPKFPSIIDCLKSSMKDEKVI